MTYNLTPQEAGYLRSAAAEWKADGLTPLVMLGQSPARGCPVFPAFPRGRSCPRHLDSVAVLNEVFGLGSGVFDAAFRLNALPVVPDLPPPAGDDDPLGAERRRAAVHDHARRAVPRVAAVVRAWRNSTAPRCDVLTFGTIATRALFEVLADAGAGPLPRRGRFNETAAYRVRIGSRQMTVLCLPHPSPGSARIKEGRSAEKVRLLVAEWQSGWRVAG